MQLQKEESIILSSTPMRIDLDDISVELSESTTNFSLKAECPEFFAKHQYCVSVMSVRVVTQRVTKLPALNGASLHDSCRQSRGLAEHKPACSAVGLRKLDR